MMGARDMSGSICDAYAKTDERVVVIHKENSGVSDTRNQGIERAKGNISSSLWTVMTG